MSLPQKFNKWRHFVSVLSQIQNRIVKEDFKDVSDEESWEPTIGTPRASLRTACTINATDTQPLAILRLFLYYVVLRKAQDLQIPYYGIPTGFVQSQRKFRPQVCLYFSQDALEIQPGENPVTGEISWRLMDETSDTLSRSELEIIGNRIKSNLGAGKGFVWRKGREMVSYSDWDEGLQLQILCLNRAEGERVVREILACASKTYDPKRLNHIENAAATAKYPSVRKKKTILQKVRDLPIERPVVNVRFRYATLSVHGITRPIHLYDRGITLTDCVVR
jgi:hypothetical protein